MIWAALSSRNGSSSLFSSQHGLSGLYSIELHSCLENTSSAIKTDFKLHPNYLSTGQKGWDLYRMRPCNALYIQYSYPLESGFDRCSGSIRLV